MLFFINLSGIQGRSHTLLISVCSRAEGVTLARRVLEVLFAVNPEKPKIDLARQHFE